MELPSQPPPDAPLPRLSAHSKRSRRWLWGVCLVGVLSVLGAAILVTPMFIRQRGGPGHEFSRAVNNMRQIGLGLLDFAAEYGSYPSDAMIPILQKQFPGDPTSLGKLSSNDYFRQLFITGIAIDERHFHAGFTPRPDGFCGSRTLEQGECTFAYIKNVSLLDPDAPLVVFPLVKATHRFDSKLCKKWGGRAAVLFTDNSVRTLPVDRSGRVLIRGRDLFDPAQPYWHGKPPDVVWPE